MARGLLGRKLGMTQIFTEDGTRLGCTVLELGPCTVLQKKERSGKDGYNAIRIAFEDVPERKLTKPELGVFKKGNAEPKRFIREVRLTDAEIGDFEVGQTFDVSTFNVGDLLDVTAVSKGRGFSGVMKRHNFRGAKRTHGVHEYFRHGGSIGMCAWPGKVIKGHRMPGQYGNKRVTIQNLSVVRSHPELNLVLVKGAVPGPKGGLVIVRTAVKAMQARIANEAKKARQSA